MLIKYFFVCLVFPLVENAAYPGPPKGKVADISLDYYFGLDDTLRSTRFMENCNSRGEHDSCQKLCGPNHACLMGKCFCVDVKPQMKEEAMDDDSAIAKTTDKGYSKLFARLRVLEELLRRSSKTTRERQRVTSVEDSSLESESEENNLLAKLIRRSSKTARERQRATSVENTSLESESEENNPTYIQLDGLAMRPTLRHHIAHFCPNLAIARSCISQCLELGKPAFCGKDHVCYCGHKYGTPKDDVAASEEYYSQFQDLYERYFGPKHADLKLTLPPFKPPPTTTTTPTTLPTTPVESSSEASGSEASSNENSGGSSNSNSKSEDSDNKSDDKNNTSDDITDISEDKTNTSDDKSNTSNDKTETSDDKTNTSNDKTNTSDEKTNTGDDKTNASDEKTNTSNDKTNTSKENKSEDKNNTDEDKENTSENKENKNNENTPEEEAKAVET